MTILKGTSLRASPDVILVERKNLPSRPAMTMICPLLSVAAMMLLRQRAPPSTTDHQVELQGEHGASLENADLIRIHASLISLCGARRLKLMTQAAYYNRRKWVDPGKVSSTLVTGRTAGRVMIIECTKSPLLY